MSPRSVTQDSQPQNDNAETIHANLKSSADVRNGFDEEKVFSELSSSKICVNGFRMTEIRGVTAMKKNCPRNFFACLGFLLLIFFLSQTAFGQPNTYSVSDATDQLVRHNHATGVTALVGSTGVADIEAIAWRSTTGVLYAANANRLGTLNLSTGAFTQLSNTFGSGNGDDGNITFDDIDALCFDPTDGTLYGVHRRTTEDDVLIKINVTNGSRINNAFGSDEYVIVSGTGVLGDIDDIAISSTGVMYAISNDSGATDKLVTINKATGAATVIGTNLTVNDMEGLAFNVDGVLYGSTGNASSPSTNNNRVWVINTTAGTASQIVPNANSDITIGGDFEGLAYNLGPQAVGLMSFTAKSDGENVLLEWQSGREVDNLGYMIFRQDEIGRETLVTPSLIAGSALVAGQNTEITGLAYKWLDKNAKGSATYWLEAIDIDGNKERFGPVSVEYVSKSLKEERGSRLLSEFAQNTNPDGQQEVPEFARQGKPNFIQTSSAYNEAANNQAIKFYINREGWYRVSRQELLDAGLSAKADLSRLQLFLRGVEQPILVNADGSIEFYGRGIDTSETDTLVYWLRVGNTQGRRVGANVSDDATGNLSQSFDVTVSKQERKLFFSALLNGDGNNFFGASIGNTPVTHTLNIRHLDQDSDAATLEVSTVGMTLQEHQIQIQLNGVVVGIINSTDREQSVWREKVSSSLLQEGDNRITLVSMNGSRDISLSDTVRLTYAKKYVAENGRLDFSIPAGQSARLTGFSSKRVRVLDVTDPLSVQEIFVETGNSSVTIPASGKERRLFAFDANASLEKPLQVKANAPSSLSKQGRRANLIAIAPSEFHLALQPLLAQREAQGFRVLLADVEDIFDEFSHGEHRAQAIKDFLRSAKSNQKQYVLLVGDSSYDSRNYFGLGNNDFVPTVFVDTDLMTTASDDSLADFNDDGVPEFAVGRLPVRSAAQVTTVVNKILAYEQQRNTKREALFVNDKEFANSSDEVAATMPDGMTITNISRGETSDVKTREILLEALQRGPQVVNFTGHGSLGSWTNAPLFKVSDVESLNNQRLSFFVMLSCLNNYSHEAVVDSLGESLLKAERGGAIAVWGSSGMSYSGQQTLMAQSLYQMLFSKQGVRFGDAVRYAKSAATNVESRKTLQFFGDPTMQIR